MENVHSWAFETKMFIKADYYQQKGNNTNMRVSIELVAFGVSRIVLLVVLVLVLVLVVVRASNGTAQGTFAKSCPKKCRHGINT
jgi:hypothetical protein